MEILGSVYSGEKLGNRPHGQGEYRYANGTIYTGSFFNGKFHGKGRLLFPSKSYVEGEWVHGELKSHSTYFSDNFRFEEENWNYCSPSDRRFNSERNSKIAPLPRTQLGHRPEGLEKIPQQTYDLGNGFFDPERNLVYSYDRSRVLETVNEQKIEWIKKKALYNPLEQKDGEISYDDATVNRILELRKINPKENEKENEKVEEKDSAKTIQEAPKTSEKLNENSPKVEEASKAGNEQKEAAKSKEDLTKKIEEKVPEAIDETKTKSENFDTKNSEKELDTITQDKALIEDLSETIPNEQDPPSDSQEDIIPKSEKEVKSNFDEHQMTNDKPSLVDVSESQVDDSRSESVPALEKERSVLSTGGD